jgi:hypothetical protein
MRVIMHTNRGRGEYFFSTDHCQRHGLKGYVASTAYLPIPVVPRRSLPSGLVTTVPEMLMIFHQGQKEIPNPDPNYQPSSF